MDEWHSRQSHKRILGVPDCVSCAASPLIKEFNTAMSAIRKKVFVSLKEEQTEKLESSMYHLIENLRQIAILIKPFMNETSENILRQIGITDESLKTWESLKDYDKIKNAKVIEKGEPIFMRLNAEEEIEYIKQTMKK